MSKFIGTIDSDDELENDINTLTTSYRTDAVNKSTSIIFSVNDVEITIYTYDQGSNKISMSARTQNYANTYDMFNAGILDVSTWVNIIGTFTPSNIKDSYITLNTNNTKIVYRYQVEINDVKTSVINATYNARTDLIVFKSRPSITVGYDDLVESLKFTKMFLNKIKVMKQQVTKGELTW